MSLQCTGARRVVEVASHHTPMEPSTITTMECVRLRTRASVRTSQVKMNQDMQEALANRSYVILNAEMENVYSKLARLYMHQSPLRIGKLWYSNFNHFLCVCVCVGGGGVGHLRTAALKFSTSNSLIKGGNTSTWSIII